MRVMVCTRYTLGMYDAARVTVVVWCVCVCVCVCVYVCVYVCVCYSGRCRILERVVPFSGAPSALISSCPIYTVCEACPKLFVATPTSDRQRDE